MFTGRSSFAEVGPMPNSPSSSTAVKPKERRAPSLNLLTEKPSSNLAGTSYEPSQHKEVPTTWNTDHVLAWTNRYLPSPVYVRKDSSGLFYTYPDLSGPFESLDDVQIAVVSHAGGSRLPEELSRKERAIREYLFWPDESSKICTRVELANREHDKIERLVRALLYKRNDDKNSVYELKDIVHWQSIWEGPGKWYYHLNITVKTKGAPDDAGDANLCFVEVGRDQNSMLGYFINTFFMFNTDNKGDEVICSGCTKNGSADMKHTPTGSFKGGHVDMRFPASFGPCNEKEWLDSPDSEEEKWIKDEEARIKKTFDYLDDAAYLENLRKKRRHIDTFVPYTRESYHIRVQEEMKKWPVKKD